MCGELRIRLEPIAYTTAAKVYKSEAMSAKWEL